MRILTLSYEYPPLGGGGSKVVQGLSAEFVRLGHEVDIVTMAYRGLRRDETIGGVRIHRVPCIRKSIDISHPHELASYIAAALPAALRIGRRENYDVLHSHFILPDAVAALWPSRKLDIPLIVTAHGSDVPGYNPDRFELIHKIISPAWRAIARSIDRIVCPSRFLERLLLEHEPRASTVAIPNGFDLAKFDPSRTRKRSIVVVTRMLERKGVQDVIRALSGLDLGYEFNVVGTGPYLDKLKELADELHVDVKFHGWLDNDSVELKTLLETSSIFVFPSHAENFPLVLLEAMAAGLAIITTNQTGCIEVVEDTALCVPPGDDGAIRNALQRLTSDDDLRIRLGQAARARLESQFSWPAVAERYLVEFNDVIARRH